MSGLEKCIVFYKNEHIFRLQVGKENSLNFFKHFICCILEYLPQFVINQAVVICYNLVVITCKLSKLNKAKCITGARK